MDSPRVNETMVRHSPPILGTPRSSGWPKVEKAHLAEQPACVACGSRKDLNAHHILPFHVRPDLELADKNLVTLCRFDHFVFGHFHDWKSWNPDVLANVAAYRKELDAKPHGHATLALTAGAPMPDYIEYTVTKIRGTSGDEVNVLGLRADGGWDIVRRYKLVAATVPPSDAGGYLPDGRYLFPFDMGDMPAGTGYTGSLDDWVRANGGMTAGDLRTQPGGG